MSTTATDTPALKAPEYVLGKPLSVKLKLAPDTVMYVPLEEVSVEKGFNARDFNTPETRDHLVRLSKLIGANGMQNPMRVRMVEDRIVLVDGESRLRSAYKARDNGSTKVDTVPVLLDPDADDLVARTEALVIKNSGRSLSMVETLNVVKRLIAQGVSKDKIQERLGFSRTHMSDLMLLDKAEPAAMDHVRAGRVSPTLVIDLLREHKDAPEIVTKSLDKAVAAQERAAERAAAAGKKKTKKVRRKPGDIIYSRGHYDGLIKVLQEVYASLTPAANFRKQRGWIKNSLENIGAPVTIEPEATEEEAA